MAADLAYCDYGVTMGGCESSVYFMCSRPGGGFPL